MPRNIHALAIKKVCDPVHILIIMSRNAPSNLLQIPSNFQDYELHRTRSLPSYMFLAPNYSQTQRR